jgi:hypothetical protein
MVSFWKKSGEGSQKAPPENTNESGVKTISSANDLIVFFDSEYKRVPAGLVFEQGGFIAKRTKGWELHVPSKIIRLKAYTDIDKFSEINFGFYGMNRAGEDGILLKVSERIPFDRDSVFQQQVASKKNGPSLLQTVFFSAEQIILPNHESFREFVLKLGHNDNLANVGEKGLKALLNADKYVEPEIDNTSGEITDEYRYVPLVLGVEALGSPRAFLTGQNWRRANRTNKYIHTHLPTVGTWNNLIREALHIERDEFNTPPDILGLQHDINRLNAPQGASSTIVTFETDRTPRIMRTFMMDLLSSEEREELINLASERRTTLARPVTDCYRSEAVEVLRFYELVKKVTVEGLPGIQ